MTFALRYHLHIYFLVCVLFKHLISLLTQINLTEMVNNEERFLGESKLTYIPLTSREPV